MDLSHKGIYEIEDRCNNLRKVKQTMAAKNTSSQNLWLLREASLPDARLLSAQPSSWPVDRKRRVFFGNTL